MITKKILKGSFLGQSPLPSQTPSPLPTPTHIHTPTTHPQSLPINNGREDLPEADLIWGDCHLYSLYPSFNFLFFKIHLFIYLLAALGLRCCARGFSSCGEQGLLFVAVRGLLTAVASLVVEHGL